MEPFTVRAAFTVFREPFQVQPKFRGQAMLRGSGLRTHS